MLGFRRYAGVFCCILGLSAVCWGCLLYAGGQQMSMIKLCKTDMMTGKYDMINEGDNKCGTNIQLYTGEIY